MYLLVGLRRRLYFAPKKNWKIGAPSLFSGMAAAMICALLRLGDATGGFAGNTNWTVGTAAIGASDTCHVRVVFLFVLTLSLFFLFCSVIQVE